MLQRLMSSFLPALLAMALLTPLSASAGSYEDYFDAVRLDAPYQFQKVMRRGLGPNLIEPEHGYTPLLLAIRIGSPKIIQLLLDTPGVDLEAKAVNGDTAIMLAAFYGDLPLVKTLLARDVQVNRPGWTALHYAAINGSSSIVKLLLDASAYIDAESAEGQMTPIMLAAMRGRTSVVRLLKEEGADLSLKNADGLTALDMARRYERMDIVDLLSQPEKP